MFRMIFLILVFPMGACTVTDGGKMGNDLSRLAQTGPLPAIDQNQLLKYKRTIAILSGQCKYTREFMLSGRDIYDPSCLKRPQEGEERNQWLLRWAGNENFQARRELLFKYLVDWIYDFPVDSSAGDFNITVEQLLESYRSRLSSAPFLSIQIQNFDVGRLDLMKQPTPKPPLQKNFIVRFQGSNQSLPKLVVGGHHDSVNTEFPIDGRIPGANDNGSGMVAMLEIINLLKRSSQPVRTIEVVFFAAEELVNAASGEARYGSIAYLEENQEAIHAALILDLIANAPLKADKMPSFLPGYNKDNHIVAFSDLATGEPDSDIDFAQSQRIAKLMIELKEVSQSRNPGFTILGEQVPGGMRDPRRYSDHNSFLELENERFVPAVRFAGVVENTDIQHSPFDIISCRGRDVAANTRSQLALWIDRCDPLNDYDRNRTATMNDVENYPFPELIDFEYLTRAVTLFQQVVRYYAEGN